MVEGLDRFRTHFADFADRYVLIGGTASTLALEEVGGSFRATKDLDVVLCIEALDRTFVEAFWAFVKAGGYENRQKSTGKRLFYRFYSPVQTDYPAMLELFSRVPDALEIAASAQLTPIPVDEAVSSLSAILMDADYYAFVMERRTVIHGLPVIPADALIPLKASAYLDLSERRQRGEAIDSKNIKKHKNDIFRLFTVLDRTHPVVVPASLQNDLHRALAAMGEEQVDLKALGISTLNLGEVLAELHRVYGLM